MSDQAGTTGEGFWEGGEDEQALQRCRTLLDAVSDGIYQLDADGRFVAVDDGIVDVTGYAREDLLGEHVSVLLEGSDAGRIEDVIRGRRETDADDATHEITIETADGDRTPCELHVDRLVDGDEYEGAVGVVRDVTEQRARENELERYETTVETVWDGVTTLDADDRFVMVNEAFCEMTGYDRDDLLGEHVTLVLDESAYEEADELHDRVAEGEIDAATLEYDLQTADGESVPVEARFGPCEFEDGTVGGTGVIRDVTEYREHERELERFEVLFTESRDVNVVLDPDGAYRYATPSMEHVFGHDPEALVGENAFDYVHPDDRERVFEEFAELVENPEREPTVEYRFRRADGSWAVVESRGRNLLDEPNVEGIVVYSRDVTERTEREQELEQYRTIVETVNDGIYTVGPDGTFTMVNEAYAEMTGYSPEELIGADVSLVVDDETAETARALERDLAAGERDRVMIEAALETADGERFPAEATFALLPTEEPDREHQRVGVVRDVTERKRQERALEESERRYRALVENFPDGTVNMFDEDLRYTAAGGQLLDALDVAPEDRIGCRIPELYPDDVVEEVEPYFHAALEGEVNDFELEFRGRHLHAHTLPVRNADGEVFAGMLVVQDVTDRKEMERDLRESEARFRMLAENLDEIVWMATPDAEEFIYLNPAFEEVWGLDREQLYDEPLSFLDAVHEADRERTREQFTALPAEDFDEEFRIVRPDGEMRWVHARGTRVTDGGMTRIVGVGQDVTERKEHERELERALDLLERTERIADVGGWEIDVNTQDVFWTDHIFDLLDVSSDEEPPLDEALAMYHEEDRPVVEGAVEEALDSGEPFDVEARIRTGGGEVRWLRLQGLPETVGGDVVSLRGAAQDVTERKERERALEESERRYRTLVENFPNGAVGLYDEDLEYTAVGGQLLDATGVEPEDRIGSSVSDIYPDELVEEVEPYFHSALDGEANEFEAEFHDRHLRAHTLPVSNADGEVFAGMLVVQDVTEQREYERQLEESNERLEQFAYAASHDLQEPLRMVSSYLQLVERRYADELDEDGREFIEFAVDGADRMREMIQGLLQYSRVETRGNPFEAIDLDAVFEDVRQDLKVKIDEHDAEITAEDLPRVYGDGSQLNQVFQNLLDNAIEYSGDAPPRVHVGAERDGDRWIVSVRDEGTGIDPGDADRVFEVFESLHGNDEYEGTGIGLALVERIVERHGGDIWVDSRPGEGARFSFTLPAAGESDE